MARRLPSSPPVIPGFSFVHVLGSGGFADVFLYEQNLPRRSVAVKVLIDEIVDEHVRRMFQSEANLMARLSTHPAIMTVFQASVANDGRPYLVMELCSASLSERYRRGPLPVSEVLSIGVKIGSALETAHREGVLHRDIKPSNILETAYGNPVLSDFGIAASIGSARPDEPVGLSVPWSAPEILADESTGSIESEVYSLAATIYSLLAGRSPFEIPGGRNGAGDLMARIERGNPRPIERADVPPTLERLLARAMARRPAERPSTVLDLVRGLQQVEVELGLPQTQADIAVNAWAATIASNTDEQTAISAAGADRRDSDRGRRRRSRRRQSLAVSRTGSASVGTVQRGGARLAARRSRIGAWTIGAGGAAIAAVAIIVLASVLHGSGGTAIPTVRDITASASTSAVTFRWSDPGTLAGDTYVITTASGTSTQVGTVFVVAGASGSQECITVAVSRAGTTGPQSAQKCATVRSG
ncbi:serine/threonine-protein kinase [Curtobacterium ammoniigenes]|uniref:serine/threonine-protein kinase n=1 Tax=Curtobacterium ammoniigenes TaxID=395387 RepID=UPI00082FD224|nr:serine/threonine-protein kinase [Curtobacterium ammoniigenes]